MDTINYEQNSVILVAKSLSRFNIDVFYKYVYYHILSSRFFYYSSILLSLKGKPLTKFILASSFKRRRLYTILRSPFVHKKSREQFEFRMFKSNFIVNSIFNTQYFLSPFAYNWISLLMHPFKNNHLQLKVENTYYLHQKTK